MTEMWKQAVGETQDAIDEKEAVDDGVEGARHVLYLLLLLLPLDLFVGLLVDGLID